MHFFYFLFFLLILTGCETFIGKKPKVFLEGSREQPLSTGKYIKPQGTMSNVHIPLAVNVSEWSMSSGNARHVMPPAFLKASPQKIWQENIESSKLSFSTFIDQPILLLNGPICAKSHVFVINDQGTVFAFDLRQGKRIWTLDFLKEDQSAHPFGGGLAYDQQKIFVTTAQAELLAIDALKGTILWRVSTSSPIRAAPTVKDGRVFVVTINNLLETYDASNGKILWSHSGTIENASLLGSASPAVHDGVVIVTYSSGEIFALRAENGYPLWSESVHDSQKTDSLSSLSHIKARPLIDKGLVFIISHNDHLAALNIRNGETVWHQPIGGLRTPTLAGDFLFLVTKDQHIVCLKRETGEIVWIKELSTTQVSSTQQDSILWSGPIVVNQFLVLAGSHKQALFLDVKTGEKIASLDLPENTTLSPIIADNTLLFLTQAGTLVAYR